MDSCEISQASAFIGRNMWSWTECLEISIDHGMTLCGCWGDFGVIAKFEPILDM